MNIILYNLKHNSLIQNRFILFLLLFYFISTRGVIAQKKAELIEKAEDCLKSQDFVNSNYYWKMLLKRDSINLYYIHNYGFTCYKIYDLKNAEYYLKKSISKDLKKEYKDDQFYLGLTLKMEGKYIDAKKEFEKDFSKLVDILFFVRTWRTLRT
jgi:tetratricopeptide (TPR) repeat protein